MNSKDRRGFLVTLTEEEFAMLDLIAKNYGVKKASAFRLMLREKVATIAAKGSA